MNKSPTITDKELREAEREAGAAFDTDLNVLFGPAPGKAYGSHRCRRPRKTARFRGIYRPGGRRRCPWAAEIQYNGQRRCLGTFTTDIEAARAYDKAARKIWGDRAVTNFPKEE